MSPQFNFGILCAEPSIEKYVAEYIRHRDDKIFMASATFSEAVRIARMWEDEGVEVLISRRATADILRQSLKIPVLSLPLSDIENLRSLNANCKQKMRVLVPAYKNRMPILGLLGKTLGLLLIQKIYTTELELRHLVESIVKDSIDCVAGGGGTALLAKEHGIPYVALPPSKEQIFNILDSARDVARANREKERLLSELEGMMNAMSEGLIHIDALGNIVSLNERAYSFFEERHFDNIIGSSFIPYLGQKTFTQMLQQRSRITNEYLIEINQRKFVAHMTRLSMKREVGHMLLTLRKHQDVLRQSRVISVGAASGFVAHSSLDDLIYKNERMKIVTELSKRYSRTNATILIQGETGTGKELLAQGIHNHSQRSAMPFVSISCAELPEHLLEGELFGHEEGAFTGSRRGGKAGLFELADRGTIFLDEISSATPSVQAKLLRVLQEGEIMRIGGTRKISLDVRIIAASGTSLWRRVREKKFRKDLFFRLNIMSVNIPPLRERLDDLDVLLPHFLHLFCKREKCPLLSLNEAQMTLLKQYAWPGNVRQFRSFVERFVLHSIFMPDPFPLLYNDLLTIFLDTDMEDMQAAYDNNGGQGEIKPQNGPKEIFSLPEKRKLVLENPMALRKLMESVRYSKKEAASLLNVSRSTLWRKLKQWAI